MHSTEKLTIDTPEQVHLEFMLAGLGSRALALFYDTLIQFIVYIVLFIVAALTLRDLGRFWPDALNWTAALLILVHFTLYWGYYAFFEAVWKGQTPGKRHTGIRVIKDDGRTIGVYEAVARNLMRAMDAFPGMYGAGVITMFLNSANRRLGDFVAGTIVVHESKEAGEQPLWDQVQGPEIAATQASLLTLQDVELIETFLQRRLDLPPAVRQTTADRIAERIQQKLQLAQKPQAASEDFLEMAVREARNVARYR